MSLTTNFNFLQPTGFKLIINREHYPNLEFFCQGVQHGGVSTDRVDVGYSRIRLKEPGETVIYGDVTFDVILDEDLEVYKELHGWLVNTVESNKNMYITDQAPLIVDVTLQILNSHSNTSSTIKYARAYPVDIGSMNLTSNTGAVQYMTMPVTFVYDYFEIN